MKSQTHFDVSEIVGIRLRPESDSHFVWRDARPKKKFLGIFTTQRALPAGFEDMRSWDDDRYSAEYLVERGYKYYPDRVQYQIVNKAVAIVYFNNHKYELSQAFESNEEMTQWAEQLKATSGKTFEIIVH